jgi:excinuclease Cho
MRLACWPYPGAVGVVERDEDLCQVHVVRNWCHLGSAPDIDAARALSRCDPGFDADGYKILCAPIVSGRVEVVPLG